MNIRLLVMLLGGISTVWAFRRWRAAVQFAIVLLVLEGALRKWLFLGAQDLIYFAKDVLLLAAYAGFFADRRKIRDSWMPRAPLLYLSLALAVGFGVLEILNPQLPNLFVGLLGFKAYFLYVPLLFVMPAVFPSDAALARFLVRYLYLSIPVGLLAVAQFFSSPTSSLNTYARPTDDLSYAVTFGSSIFVRVTGTFSFITGYSAYLTAIVMLSLAVLATTRWRFRGNLKIYVTLGMAILGMLMTGSRGPVVVVGAMLPLYWWLAVAREKQGGATFGRLLVVIVLLGSFIGVAGQDALGAFRGRAAGSGEELGQRILSPFTAPFAILPDAGALGYGIGATHQAATEVTKGIAPFSWLNGHLIEVESGRVMLELGPLGFLIVYLSRLALTLFSFQQVFRLQTLFHRSIAVACFLVFLSSLPTGIVFDVTTGLLYWFFGGLLFLVMRLDRQRAIAAQAVVAPAAQTTRPQRVAALGASPASRAPLWRP
jgi:hypothetical protein